MDGSTEASRLAEFFGRKSTGPLAGVVVADLSRVLAGPYCTMMLADMGALVIKVESIQGDDTRSWAPPRRGEDSTYFLSVNRGKYSIALDFKDAENRAVLEQIIDRADVLVQNFRPGSLDKYGLDYESIRRRRPDLVYASITGFGPGRGADMAGYDLLAQALSGMMDLTGTPDGEPLKVGVALFDVMTGLHAAVGILGALHDRQHSGLGEHIQVNLLSSALSGLVNQTSALVAGGVVPTRMGNEHPSLYPYEPFPTRDTELVVAVGNDTQFARLCECLGISGLASDERFATMAARNVNRAELRGLLTERFRARGAQGWFERLKDVKVPSAPILTVAGGMEFAESLGLEPVALAGGGGRTIPTVSHPISYGRARVDYSQAPPELDADRSRVVRWLEATLPTRGMASEAGVG